MAEVKINRELLGKVIRDLGERHSQQCLCTMTGVRCLTVDRIARVKGLLLRSSVDADG